VEQYSKAAFTSADEQRRATLLAELADTLTARFEPTDFHSSVGKLVGELRSLGHDLWSYDEEDEYEIWGPDYHTPKGPGIIVTFRDSGSVTVAWSKTVSASRTSDKS